MHDDETSNPRDRAVLNLIRACRERGWRPLNAADYAAVWSRFGGSLVTQPDVVERLSAMAGIPVRYLGWFEGDEPVAAAPTWGRHLALSRDALKRAGKRHLFDLGNAEVLLPARPDSGAVLRHRGAYLGEPNQSRLRGCACRRTRWRCAVRPRSSPRSSATTSAASCACWRRPVAP